MSERHRPGVKMKLYPDVGKSVMALKEIKSNKEPLPGAGQAYM